MKRFHRTAVVLMAALLLCGALPVVCSAGYDAHLWINAKGTYLHTTGDGGTSVTSFIRYRQVEYATSDLKAGHFRCTHEGHVMQVPVREIKQIRLAQTFKEFQRYANADRYKNLILTMKNGDVFKVSVEINMAVSLANNRYIEFKYYNPVTQKFDFGGVTGDMLREINFD